MSDSDQLFSVIVPVGTRVGDLADILRENAAAMEGAGLAFEFIVILDGPKPDLVEHLRTLSATNDWLRVLQFSRPFGESAALMAGFNEARGKLLVTLPAYWQVEPTELPRFLTTLEAGDDMLIGRRTNRAGTGWEVLRRRVFHSAVRMVTGQNFHDLGCGVRVMRRPVADEAPLYGDQYRFLPLLALRRGFRVREIGLAQSPKDRFIGRYRIRDYLHNALNLMTIFFLVRFTRKPLRFFGSLGFIAAAIGSLFVTVLVIQRLFFGVALADRPALLLGALLAVLGVQLFAIGLLGELIIFSHAGNSKEYAIRSIIEGGTKKDVPVENRWIGAESAMKR